MHIFTSFLNQSRMIQSNLIKIQNNLHTCEGEGMAQNHGRVQNSPPFFFLLNESSNVKEYRKTRYALVRRAIPKGRWFRPPGRLFSRVSFFPFLISLFLGYRVVVPPLIFPSSVHNCPMFARSSSSVPIKNENNIIFLFCIYFFDKP